MSALTVMALLAVISWTFRIAFITAIHPDRLPTVFTQALEHLGPPVLAAIATVELVTVVRHGRLTENLTTAAAIALVALVAYRWRNLSVTVAAGLGAILIIDLLIFAA
jgi:branched-subunit amino acid transport protein